MGVTLGDSIIGIGALDCIKKINKNNNINLIRPETCHSYVEADSTIKCNAKPHVLALQRPLKVARTPGIFVACYSVLPDTSVARHP